MSAIIIVIFIAAVCIAYIWGEDAGYKKGRKAVFSEMKNLHKNVDAYSMMREASSRAASKQAPPHRRKK